VEAHAAAVGRVGAPFDQSNNGTLIDASTVNAGANGSISLTTRGALNLGAAGYLQAAGGTALPGPEQIAQAFDQFRQA